MIFFLENPLPNLLANQSEESADLLDVLSGRMDCFGFLAIRYLANLAERSGQLLMGDSPDTRRDKFACLQTITHNETID